MHSHAQLKGTTAGHFESYPPAVTPRHSTYGSDFASVLGCLSTGTIEGNSESAKGFALQSTVSG